jgi:hypothetical protein
MTNIRTSSFAQIALALGLVFAVSTPAAFASTVQAADAHASSGVRCFMSTNSNAKNGVPSGWVCFPQYHNADAHQS